MYAGMEDVPIDLDVRGQLRVARRGTLGIIEGSKWHRMFEPGNTNLVRTHRGVFIDLDVRIFDYILNHLVVHQAPPASSPPPDVGLSLSAWHLTLDNLGMLPEATASQESPGHLIRTTAAGEAEFVQDLSVAAEIAVAIGPLIKSPPELIPSPNGARSLPGCKVYFALSAADGTPTPGSNAFLPISVSVDGADVNCFGWIWKVFRGRSMSSPTVTALPFAAACLCRLLRATSMSVYREPYCNIIVASFYFA
jgi:hypothetical protein